MVTSKQQIETAGTILKPASQLKSKEKLPEVSLNAAPSPKGTLYCFQSIDGDWRSKQFPTNATSLSAGPAGSGYEVELSSEDVDSPHILGKKFNGKWYLMEIGRKDLTRINGIPSRQIVLAVNESAAVSIAGELLIFIYSTGAGGEKGAMTSGTPGTNSFYIESAKGVKYPFGTDSPCLMGGNSLCGFCTSAPVFKGEFSQTSDADIFGQDFLGIFFKLKSRLLFTAFDERIKIDGASALAPHPVVNGSELSCGKTVVKINVPESLVGQGKFLVPKAPKASVLALLPIPGQDESLPEIEIPAARRSVTIGRSSKASDVVIIEPSLSRKHSQLIVYDKNIMLFDCGSSNGTFVNGEKTTKKTIRPGDTVSFGDVSYFFCYAEN